MDATAVALISGVVVGIISVLKSSGLVEKRFAVLISAALAALGVWVWSYAHGPFIRANAFDYLAGWAVCFTSAAGVYGLGKGAGNTLDSAKEAVGAVKDAAVSITKTLTGGGTGKG